MTAQTSYPTQQYFRVRNLEEYQHYKTGRSALWVKLYCHILHDPGWTSLPEREKLTMLALIPLGQMTGNRMPFDREWVRNQLGLTRIPKLNLLIDIRFIEMIASILLAPVEESRGEKNRTIVHCGNGQVADLVLTPPPGPPLDALWLRTFHKWFWPDYPRKEKKIDAQKAYVSLMPERKPDAEAMARGICDLLEHRKEQWKDRDRNKIPLPGSWLRAESFQPADITESMLEEVE